MFPLRMHVNTDSLATVLSFHLLQSVEGVRITYDSDDKDAFSVTYKGKCYEFGQGGGGLYYFDVSNCRSLVYDAGCSDAPSPVPLCTDSDSDSTCSNRDELDQHVTPYSFVKTVASNKALYTKSDILGAEKAHNLQESLIWPSVETLKTGIKTPSCCATQASTCLMLTELSIFLVQPAHF